MFESSAILSYFTIGLTQSGCGLYIKGLDVSEHVIPDDVRRGPTKRRWVVFLRYVISSQLERRWSTNRHFQ